MSSLALKESVVTKQPIKAMVNRAQLAAAVAFVKRTVERRNTIPILAYVRLTACKGGLVVLGTDLDREIFATAAGTVDRKFDVTAPCHRLDAILMAAGASDDVAMEISEDSGIDQGDPSKILILNIGKSRFTLSTLPIADFPDLGAKEMPWTFAMPTADLAGALNRVKFCMSQEETRYYLNGVYMQEDRQGRTPDQHGQLSFVATDGHKLGKVMMDLPEGAGGMEPDSGFIIPRLTVDRVIEACEARDAPDSVTIMVGRERIIFDLGGVQIRSKLIDGTFPDYYRVIPSGNDKILIVDPREMVAAIKEVGIMGNDSKGGVKLSINGDVRLSVSNPDEGIATTTIDGEYKKIPIVLDGQTIDQRDGRPAPMDIGFNRSYASQILDHLESDRVELKLADMGSPVLFTGLGPEDHGVLFVLMPMRV